MPGRRDETPYEEAAELSASRGAALPGLEDDDGDYDFDDDPDIADLNNPDVESLSDPPLLGVQPRPVDLGFGEEAQPFGRATSPKLYASAAQFPTAVQFRVWRWENGVPVGLGAIDAEATEEDFVRAFLEAMPKSGQGNFQFRLRPIDVRGRELGKEFTLNISEHHATLRQLRELKRREEEERMHGGSGYWGRGGPTGGDIIVNPGGYDQAGASYAEEMGRMFEQAVESAEEQNRVLRDSLEMERERLREEEKTRAEERISMAERSATSVEKMMERLMSSDRARSEEAMKGQQQHSNFMMQTLTSVFAQQQEASRHMSAQQQEAARIQSERLREADERRMQQDREFFERQRQEMEARRQQERDEAERRRRVEREEGESRRVQEREEFERRRRLEAEEWERKRSEERERLSMEQRRWEESRRQEMEQARLDAARREQEMEQRRQQEKEEAQLRVERERMELEQRREQIREERERMRIELEERRRQEQMEFERKMALEKEERDRREQAAREERERREKEFERKLQMEREERERRERMERERWEREKQENERKREEERREWERRESLRREEMQRESEQRREQLQREAEQRREEVQLQLKQMEANATRDREHAERMMEMARIEREAQREAQLAREKAEQQAREQAAQDRQRQHELQMREMELSKERDREHAERMLQLSKMENSSGLSGITDMLGMDTPEVLARIFSAAGGGGSEEGGGWVEAIPKTLGALAEAWAKTMSQRNAPPPRQVTQQQRKLIPIQTPEGVKMIPAEALAQLRAQQGAAGIPVTAPHPVPDDDDDDFVPDGLPSKPFIPKEKEEKTAQAAAKRPAQVKEEEETGFISPELEAGMQVNCVKRAKEAGMKFSAQRGARRALRDLMPKLTSATEEEWIGVIAEALMKEPAIYDYLKAVTVYAALAEARVSPSVAEKTVKEMRASGMIPDEIPFDEADLRRLAGAEEEPAEVPAEAIEEIEEPEEPDEESDREEPPVMTLPGDE